MACLQNTVKLLKQVTSKYPPPSSLLDTFCKRRWMKRESKRKKRGKKKEIDNEKSFSGRHIWYEVKEKGQV